MAFPDFHRHTASMTSLGWVATLVLVGVFVANIHTTVTSLSWIRHVRSTSPAELSWIGDAYPVKWDVPGLAGPVELTFAETAAYPIDGPLASELWISNRLPETHQGFIRLGPDKRMFAVAMYHQLHCIHTFRTALINPDDHEADYGHLQHCFAYLRQFFLCAADDTLEPGDFMRQDYDADRMGHTRACRDWSAVYDASDRNYWDWIDFKRANGTYKVEW